ncbi:polysaccharide deacetylase family protein [Treponema sp. C6A8]|uniref:polysaccharide deacetylase family protein n=1 Tax=Treponema sp. C6A8 TaxID=1410609 RepID=UPI000488EC81|nr:polysaccharide deacetylase family protein [Treponema sp. C6A8]
MSKLKNVIKKSLFGKFLLNLKHIFNRFGDYGYVLMLHRIGEINPNGISDNENMKVSPEYLKRLILDVQKKYDIISISDIADRLKTKQKRKFVCFTFDDGYKDNFTIAYPIFKKLNAPFTVFTAACFPNRTALLWWFKVEELLLKNECIKLSDGSNFICKSLKEKNIVFSEIRKKILQLNQLNLEEELNNLFSDYTIDWRDKDDELCLTWKEISMLHKDPLVTIGAHTSHHYNLKQLNSNEEVKQEILEGIYYFEKYCGFKPMFFAYPFGSSSEVGEREYRVVQEIGFSSAYLGYGAGIKKYTNSYSYPRIALMDNTDIKKLL